MKSKIVSSASVLFGKPRIKGSRIAVEQVLSCLAEGWTNKKIMKLAIKELKSELNFIELLKKVLKKLEGDFGVLFLVSNP